MIANRIAAPSVSKAKAHGRPVSLNDLRPRNYDEYVGQAHCKRPIRTSALASQKQNEPFPHTLLSGGAGLGKTSLAAIIAGERDVPFYPVAVDEMTNAQSIHRILANLEMQGYDSQGQVVGPIKPDVLFVDEIHRLDRGAQELLLTALEDRVFDSVEKNPLTGNTEVRRQWVPCFSLVGATNRPGDLTQAFRDRMRLHLRLESYPVEDLSKIAAQAFDRLGIQAGEQELTMVAKRGRGIPRYTISIVLMVRDVCVTRDKKIADVNACLEAFEALGLDQLGLTRSEVEMLRHLAEAGRPVGLSGVAEILGEEASAIQATIEPFLIRQGLIARTGRGRSITDKGLKHLQNNHGYRE